MTTAPSDRQAAAEETKRRVAAGELTHRQILVVFSGLMLGMFLAALDQTIVITAIRTISDDLNGLDEQAWATTAFLITSTISTPLYGKLSDLYGRKPFFLTAITIFLVGSLACTLVQDMYQLAACRALQGLGAGGLFSLALAIVADIVPARQRAKYQGYFLAVFGTSSVLGPLIGGFLAGQDTILGVAGWRWLFLVNLPVGALALIVVSRVLQLPHRRMERTIDWWGAATIAVFLVPLLIVAEQGQSWGWDSQRAIICYIVGAVGLIAFLLAERRAGDDALLPFRLFRSSVFSLMSVIGLFIGIGMFGAMSILPQYLQIVKGSTPTAAGFQTLPLVVGIMLSSVLAGQLTSRTGRYKIFPVIGTVLMVAGLLLMTRLDVDTSLLEADVYMLVFGLGLGMCMQTLMLAMQNAVSARDMGVATSSGTFFRQMGGTMGTAVFLSILFSTLGTNIASSLRQAVPTPTFRTALAEAAQARAQGVTGVRAEANYKILDLLKSGPQAGSGGGGGVLKDSSFLINADPRLARPFISGFADSMHPVFITGAAVVAAAFLLVLFVKETPLRSEGGIQAREAEFQAEAAASAAANGTAEVPEPDPTEVTVRMERVPSEQFNGAQPLAAVGAPAGAVAAGGMHNGSGMSNGTGNGAGNGVGHGTGNGAGNGMAAVPANGAGATGRHGFGGVAGPGMEAASMSARHAGGEFQPGESVWRNPPDPGSDMAGNHMTGNDMTGSDMAGAGIPGNGGAPGAGNGGVPTDAGQANGWGAAVGGGWFSPESATAQQPAPVAGIPISGRVHAGDGTGIPSAALTLIDLSGRQVGRSATDQSGGYQIEAPQPGTYVLIASAGSHQPEATTVAVGPAPLRTDVVLSGTSALLGRVLVAGSAEPVPNAITTLADSRGEVVGSQRSGADGGYVFGRLMPGGYTLVVSAERYRPTAVSVMVGAVGETVRDVELIGGSRLHGFARTAVDGRAIPDARITLLDAAGNVVGVTNTSDDGSYNFGDLNSGDYTVIASGYPPVASTLRVAAGQHDEHDVELGHPDA